MKLNFTMSELLHSDVAKQYNISNIPSSAELDNLLTLIVECLQPIRDYIGKPMIISSGFRSVRLNAHPKINGVKNSQHTTGQAVDFTIKGLSPKMVVKLVEESGVEFDQLINEYNLWTHISYCKGKNRKQVLEIK